MSDKTFNVEVVSAERSILSVEATAVYARSLDGEIGILAGHQPCLLALAVAPVTVVTATENVRVAVHHGFLFYQDDTLVILADMAELASEIDAARARARQQDLSRQLENKEHVAVRAAIKRQTVRLSLVD